MPFLAPTPSSGPSTEFQLGKNPGGGRATPPGGDTPATPASLTIPEPTRAKLVETIVPAPDPRIHPVLSAPRSPPSMAVGTGHWAVCLVALSLSALQVLLLTLLVVSLRTTAGSESD
ncbi:hypothetical protein BO71DRAFT_394816 [Aspergillus ellipticus CBS 707.79]|uniref:Uncharacterized protein n=1 Tax=Aspergillus ellipticus CBS 707.79 TaxID=1448320 RepID=A0A319DXE3_9EURO|nr:hypothetical protein BO71DRAFT_394816 [Aspergillus ellipticus CBS 707.79]